jgi:glycosyltransferase involved in cell wall biosynthesis
VSRLRIVHVVVAGDIGGAERLLVDLASRPEASGADHTVALMTPNERLAAYFSGAGLRVVDRGRVRENAAAYLWRSLGPRDVAWLTDVLRAERADVTHLHTFASHVVGLRAARRAGVPVMRTEHHVQYFVDLDTRFFTRWSLDRVDAAVAISDYVASFVASIAPRVAPRLHVVRNGVDADYFAPRPSPLADSDPFTFAVVCRLEPWKGVDLVVDALREVPGARLDVIGDGSDRAALEARARASGLEGRVRFLGYRKDPRDAFAACDAAINSSRDEPLGLSVLEAQAMGRPVLAFAGGGIPEVVRDGETGWLVRERTVAALAAAMCDAASDRPRARLRGEAARAFVDREHRVERMCEGYGRVYAALAGSSVGSSVSASGNVASASSAVKSSSQ